jgi:hypothetical protein
MRQAERLFYPRGNRLEKNAMQMDISLKDLLFHVLVL